jgi:hypothetical protein
VHVSRFIQSDFRRNYDSLLNRLNFRTPCLDILLLVSGFKDKANCSIMGTIDLRVPRKQVKDFPTFNVNNASLS